MYIAPNVEQLLKTLPEEQLSQDEIRQRVRDRRAYHTPQVWAVPLQYGYAAIWLTGSSATANDSGRPELLLVARELDGYATGVLQASITAYVPAILDTMGLRGVS